MSKDKMELKEAIEVLKNERHELGLYADGEKIKLGFAIETVLQSLEKLQKRCKELIEEKQELTSALLDSIPKEKIEDKIEELKKKVDEYENYKADGDFMNFFGNEIRKVNAQIFILQELLEDK